MSTGAETRLRALDSVLDEASTSDLNDLASDLFAVVDALDSSISLRRALTDPSTSEQGRQQLVHSLLDGKVSTTAADLVAAGAAMRWSGGASFTAAVERQAVRAQLNQGEEAGQLGEAEDELFRFSRLVEGTPDLRSALANRSVDLSRRQELVGELLEGRATPTAVVLAKRAVLARDRSFAATIEGFVNLAAEQRNRVIATVRVAQPLTPEQRIRLQASLTKQAGRQVALQEVIDPSVLGGVRVEFGDEVVEGTVAGRLEAARRLFG